MRRKAVDGNRRRSLERAHVDALKGKDLAAPCADFIRAFFRCATLLLLGSRLRLHPAAVGEVNRRIENHLVSRLDAVAHFDLRSEVARHRDFADMGHAILHYGDLHAVAVENDGVGRDQQRRHLARNVQLDRAIDSGLKAPSGLGMSISVSNVRVPGCRASAIRVTLPGNVRSGISGTRTTASTPGAKPNASSCGTKTWVRITLLASR